MAAHSSALAWRIPGKMDGGAWWAAVYGVTQSRTRLKRLTVTVITKTFQTSRQKDQLTCK